MHRLGIDLGRGRHVEAAMAYDVFIPVNAHKGRFLIRIGKGTCRPVRLITNGHIKSRHLVFTLRRLGFDWRRPERLPKHADPVAQKDFIAQYERLVDGLPPDEKGVFVDAVHPEHQSRPTHGWFYKDDRPAVKTTTGRQRLNIHAALDLEEMRLVRVQGERINAKTTLDLFKDIEKAWPEVSTVHRILDNARYHHAKMLKHWLERPECCLKLHFLPSYAPHLNPI